MTIQHQITLAPMRRGVHLITAHIEPFAKEIQTGTAHIFLKHTSASLGLGENYDPTVRQDIESFLRHMIPDGWSGFAHTLEGDDDMPAHMKNIFIGSDLTLPVTNGRLALGTWQGIYLLEHRNYGSQRDIVLTLNGNKGVS